MIGNPYYIFFRKKRLLTPFHTLDYFEKRLAIIGYTVVECYLLEVYFSL